MPRIQKEPIKKQGRVTSEEGGELKANRGLGATNKRTLTQSIHQQK